MLPDSDLTLGPWKLDPADVPDAEAIEERAQFLLRYAILAPSSHNSQPWAFRVEGDGIELRIDESRWLREADPDRRELHLSLGCALENLLLAARHFGHAPVVRHTSEPGHAVVARVELGPASADADPEQALFEAIVLRRTVHGAFSTRPLPHELIDEFERSAERLDVRLVRVEGTDRERVAKLQREADERQMDDEAYRRELGEWVGSGALGDSWPKARIARWVVTHFDLGEREGQDNARLIRQAPMVAVLTTSRDDVESQLRAGRAYERIALLATARNAATHPLSQILEVPELKERLANLLTLEEEVPQHLFRAGETEGNDTHTPRWPLPSFLVE